MSTSVMVWVTVAASLLFIVVSEPEVLDWLTLVSKVIGIWARRQWFLIRYNPDTPWMRYEMDRSSRKIAKQLMKERDERGE